MKCAVAAYLHFVLSYVRYLPPQQASSSGLCLVETTSSEQHTSVIGLNIFEPHDSLGSRTTPLSKSHS